MIVLHKVYFIFNNRQENEKVYVHGYTIVAGN